MAAKPRALFLSAEPPYPTVGGGALRSVSILEFLLEGYDTDVICFRQPGIMAQEGCLSQNPSWVNLRRWINIPLPYHGKSAMQRGLRNINRTWRGVPPLVDRFSGFERQINDALATETYQTAVVEHFWCASYAPLLRAHCACLVLDLHNIESLWHERCARVLSPWIAPLHRSFARSTLRLEQELLPLFDLILTTSQTECHSISNRFPGLPVSAVPNTIRWRDRPTAYKDASIVFSGNMEYLPNQKGAQHFAREIWPTIASAQPGLQWKIVGKAATHMGHLLRDCPRLRLVDDPDDAMMEIAKSFVAVVPLTTGTGTRLKIIEAWAAGCPVVSTTVGAEGLLCTDGVEIMIEDTPLGFAQAVSRIVDNEAWANRLVEAGRARFEMSYSWKSAWEALRQSGL